MAPIDLTLLLNTLISYIRVYCQLLILFLSNFRTLPRRLKASAQVCFSSAPWETVLFHPQPRWNRTIPQMSMKEELLRKRAKLPSQSLSPRRIKWMSFHTFKNKILINLKPKCIRNICIRDAHCGESIKYINTYKCWKNIFSDFG